MKNRRTAAAERIVRDFPYVLLQLLRRMDFLERRLAKHLAAHVTPPKIAPAVSPEEERLWDDYESDEGV